MNTPKGQRDRRAETVCIKVIYSVLQMLAFSFMVFDSQQLSQYFNEANYGILLRPTTAIG